MDIQKMGISIMLVLGIMVLFLVPGAVAGSLQSPAESLYLGSISTPRFSPAVISPGDVVTMNVDVTNNAVLLDMVDVNAVLGVSNYFTPLSSVDSVGVLHPSATNTFLLSFKVNTTTSPGYYTIYLTLNYLRDGEPVSQKETINVPVSVIQKNLVIDLNPKTISPGNQTTITYSITNNGLTPVSNILLTWNDSVGLILPIGSDNRSFISRIAPGETVDVNYLVATDPNITTGVYPLTVNLSYTDSNGVENQKSTVGIIAGGATDFDVSSETTNGQVSFSIANVGSNNAAAVVVKIARQAGLIISGSDTVVIGSLNKGDYSIANFSISASADANGLANGSGFSRRNGGAQATASTDTTSAGTTNGSASAGTSANGAPSADRNFAGGFQMPASYVVDIYYTDTTGTRQHVQKNFSLNSRTSTGFGLSGTTGANGNGSTDWVLVGIVLALIVAGGAVFNKVKAKKEWKNLAIAALIGIVVPVLALFLVPRVYVPVILTAAFILAVLIGFFKMGKKIEGSKK